MSIENFDLESVWKKYIFLACEDYTRDYVKRSPRKNSNHCGGQVTIATRRTTLFLMVRGDTLGMSWHFQLGQQVYWKASGWCSGQVKTLVTEGITLVIKGRH